MEAWLTDLIADWTWRDVVAFVGTTLIVFGLCNLSFGDKKSGSHLARSAK